VFLKAPATGGEDATEGPLINADGFRHRPVNDVREAAERGQNGVTPHFLDAGGSRELDANPWPGILWTRCTMYQPKSEFTGGSIDKVVCDVADFAYIESRHYWPPPCPATD
jgi:hypothetical protein